jgi:hypothetical protein
MALLHLALDAIVHAGVSVDFDSVLFNARGHELFILE